MVLSEEILAAFRKFDQPSTASHMNTTAIAEDPDLDDDEDINVNEIDDDEVIRLSRISFFYFVKVTCCIWVEK